MEAFVLVLHLCLNGACQHLNFTYPLPTEEVCEQAAQKHIEAFRAIKNAEGGGKAVGFYWHDCLPVTTFSTEEQGL